MGRRLTSYIEAHGITVEIADGPHWDVESYADARNPWEHHRYTLTLRNEDLGTEMTIPWRTGIAVTTSPDDEPEYVLDGLISEAWSVETARSYEDWAGDFGMNPDMPDTFKLWKACCKIADELVDFLGGKSELEKLALKFERL